MIAGAGADAYDGGGNIDTLDFSGSAGGSIDVDSDQCRWDWVAMRRAILTQPLKTSLARDQPIAFAAKVAVNVLTGGAGDDILEGAGGADVLDGGDDSDTAAYTNAGSGVSASLATNSGSAGDALGDSFLKYRKPFGFGICRHLGRRWQ